MKQVRKLKLSQLSKNELEKKELKKLKGGGCCICGGGGFRPVSYTHLRISDSKWVHGRGFQ